MKNLMAWYNGLFNRRKKQLDPARLSGMNLSRVGTGAITIAGQQDRIFKVFDNCGLDYDKLDPKTQMRLSRLMYSIFPFVKRALNDISSMVGNIRLAGDLPETTLADLEKLVKQLPILSEHDWENPHEYGFNNLVFRIARTALRDGMCFIESRQEGESGEYLGELIYDSANFEYVKEDLGPIKLIYKAEQYPDIETGMFRMIGYDYTNEHPWASPLVAGGGFFTHILIAMLIAIKNVNMRKGAPAETYLISVKDDEALKSNPARVEAFKNAVTSIEEELEAAAKAQLDGVPYTIVGKMPLGVDLLSKAFGSDTVQEVDHNTLTLVLVQVLNLLDVPPEMFGVVVGASGGFSGERFRILYKIWSGKVDNLREKVRPIMLQILRAYLQGQGVDARVIQRLEIEFENTEILDDKEVEETGKLEAEKEGVQIDNAGKLAQIDTNNATEYLRDRGLIE